MTRATGLAARLGHTIAGRQWHGPVFGVLVRDVDAGQAAAHPIRGAHSIWEIVLHVSAWARIARTRLGGTKHDPTSAEDWPPVVDQSPKAWRRALDELEESHARLQQAVVALSDVELAARAAGKAHTVHDMVRGVIEHGIYHGGQVALLKRALEPARSKR